MSLTLIENWEESWCETSVGYAAKMEMQFIDQLFNQPTLHWVLRQCNLLININDDNDDDDDDNLPTKTDVELCWGPYGHNAWPGLDFSKW